MVDLLACRCLAKWYLSCVVLFVQLLVFRFTHTHSLSFKLTKLGMYQRTMHPVYPPVISTIKSQWSLCCKRNYVHIIARVTHNFAKCAIVTALPHNFFLNKFGRITSHHHVSFKRTAQRFSWWSFPSIDVDSEVQTIIIFVKINMRIKYAHLVCCGINLRA